jgi:hypothetical protein
MRALRRAAICLTYAGLVLTVFAWLIMVSLAEAALVVRLLARRLRGTAVGYREADRPLRANLRS